MSKWNVSFFAKADAASMDYLNQFLGDQFVEIDCQNIVDTMELMGVLTTYTRKAFDNYYQIENTYQHRYTIWSAERDMHVKVLEAFRNNRVLNINKTCSLKESVEMLALTIVKGFGELLQLEKDCDDFKRWLKMGFIYCNGETSNTMIDKLDMIVDRIAWEDSEEESVKLAGYYDNKEHGDYTNWRMVGYWDTRCRLLDEINKIASRDELVYLKDKGGDFDAEDGCVKIVNWTRAGYNRSKSNRDAAVIACKPNQGENTLSDILPSIL